MLLEAVAAVRERLPNVELLIRGKGHDSEYLDVLKERAIELGIHDIVKFEGFFYNIAFHL